MPVYAVKNNKTGKNYDMPWDNEKPPTSYDVAKYVDEQEGRRDSTLTKLNKIRQKPLTDYLPDALHPSNIAEKYVKPVTDWGMEKDTGFSPTGIAGKAAKYGGAWTEAMLGAGEQATRPDMLAMTAATMGAGRVAGAGYKLLGNAMAAPGRIMAGKMGLEGGKEAYEGAKEGDWTSVGTGAAKAALGGFGAYINPATSNPALRGPKPTPTIEEPGPLPSISGGGRTGLQTTRPSGPTSEAPPAYTEADYYEPKMLPPRGGTYSPPEPPPPPASIAPPGLPPKPSPFYGGPQGGGVSRNINEVPTRTFTGGGGPGARIQGRFAPNKPMEEVMPSSNPKDYLEQNSPYRWAMQNPTTERLSTLPSAASQVNEGSVVDPARVRPDVAPEPVVPPRPISIAPTPRPQPPAQPPITSLRPRPVGGGTGFARPQPPASAPGARPYIPAQGEYSPVSTGPKPTGRPYASLGDNEVDWFAGNGDKEAIAELNSRGLQPSVRDPKILDTSTNANSVAQSIWQRIQKEKAGEQYTGGRPESQMNPLWNTDLEPVDPKTSSMERYNPTLNENEFTRTRYPKNSYKAPTDLEQAGQTGLPDVEMLRKPYPPKWPRFPMKFGQYLEAKPPESIASQGEQLPVAPIKPGGEVRPEIGPTSTNKSGWSGEPLPSEPIGNLNYQDIQPPTAEMERMSLDFGKEARNRQLTRGSDASINQVWDEASKRFVDRPGQEPMMPRGPGRIPKTGVQKIKHEFPSEPLSDTQRASQLKWREQNKEKIKLIEAEHERLYPMRRLTADDKIARMEKLGALFGEAVSDEEGNSIGVSPESFDRKMTNKYGLAFDRMKRQVNKDYELASDEAKTRFDPADELDTDVQDYLKSEPGGMRRSEETVARGDVLEDPLGEHVPLQVKPKAAKQLPPAARTGKVKEIPVLADISDQDLNLKAAEGDKTAQLALKERPWVKAITERENLKPKPQALSKTLAERGPIGDINAEPEQSMAEWKGMEPGKSEMDIWKEGTVGKKATAKEVRKFPKTPEDIEAELKAQETPEETGGELENLDTEGLSEEAGKSFREKLGEVEMNIRRALGEGGSEEGAVKLGGGGLKKPGAAAAVKKLFTSREAPESTSEKALKVQNKEKALDWTTRRAASGVHGAMVAEDFADLKSGGIKTLDRFVQGDRQGRLADVQKELDTIYKEEYQSGATEMNKPAWMKAVMRPKFLDKDGSPLPPAAYRSGRMPDTYKEGLAMGLKPLHEDTAAFLEDVTRRSKTRIANKQFDEHLEDTDQKKPTGFNRDGDPTYTSVASPNVVRSLAGKDTGTLSLSRRARLKKYIENVHGNDDEYGQIAGSLAAKSKNLYLAGGIPGTPLNMHGWSIGRSMFKVMGKDGVMNFVKGIKDPKWLDAERKRLRPLVREAIDQGYQTTAGEADTHDALSKWFAKYPISDAILNKGMEFQEKWLEDPLFKRALPAWKDQVLEARVKDIEGRNNGWSREKILKEASKQANDFMGGQNKTLRSKNMQNLAQSVFLAPDWAESQIKQGVKGVKSVFGKEDPIYREAMARNAGVRAVGLAIQKSDDEDSDKPTDITSVGLGKTASGRHREYSLYNASDPMNLTEIGLAGAVKGDLRPASRFLKNRLNQPIQSLINATYGIDSYGNPITGEDQFGRKIKPSTSLLNYIDELTKPAQPQVGQAAMGYLRGKIGAEEALMQSVEAPIKYSAPQKKGGGSRGRRRSR